MFVRFKSATAEIVDMKCVHVTTLDSYSEEVYMSDEVWFVVLLNTHIYIYISLIMMSSHVLATGLHTYVSRIHDSAC